MHHKYTVNMQFIVHFMNVFFSYNKPKIVSMFMCVVKLTFTHTVCFLRFRSKQQKNTTSEIKINQVLRKFFFWSIFDNKHLSIKMESISKRNNSWNWKKNLISRYVFQYIPYIPRKKCFQKKWKLFKNIKKKKIPWNSSKCLCVL